MINSAERRRLVTAYAMPADANPVLRMYALAVLAVVVVGAAAITASPLELVAGITEQQAVSGR